MDETEQWKVTRLIPEHIQWFESKGCVRKRVACPKGAMLLCDARMFRADARPIKDRINKDRWRFMVYVCMTPSAWASDHDLAIKKKAYEKMLFTNSWPSQKVSLLQNNFHDSQISDPYPNFTLPDVACTDEAKMLAGVLSYSNLDEDPEFSPAWNEDKWDDFIEKDCTNKMRLVGRKLTGPLEADN